MSRLEMSTQQSLINSLTSYESLLQRLPTAKKKHLWPRLKAVPLCRNKHEYLEGSLTRDGLTHCWTVCSIICSAKQVCSLVQQWPDSYGANKTTLRLDLRSAPGRELVPDTVNSVKSLWLGWLSALREATIISVNACVEGEN